MQTLLENSVPRFWRPAGFALGSLASCYIGLLFARLLWDAPLLLVAAFTDAEVVGAGRFGPLRAIPALYVLQPSEASPLMFALYAGGAIAVALALLAACRAFADSLPSWPRLALVFLGFWTATLLGGAAVGFVSRGVGPLATLGTMIDGASSLVGRRIVASAVILLCWFCLMRLLQSLVNGPGIVPEQRPRRLMVWFVLPAVALIVLLSAWQLGRLRQFGDVPSLLIVASVPILGAVRFPRPVTRPFAPSMAGAASTVVVGAVSLSLMTAYPSMARRPERPQLESLTSQHWEISFESGALSSEERQTWAREADVRLEEFSQRLGIPLNGVRLQSLVFSSTRGKRAMTRETRDDQPYTVGNDPASVYQLLSPGGTLTDPRGEALLLMAHSWGPAAAQPVAEALARYAAGSYIEQPLAGYARRIACEERPYTLAEILEIEPHYVSPLVRDALGGAWVESLVEEYGVDALPRVYRAIPATEGAETIAGALGASWNDLEASWKSYLERTDVPCEPPESRAELAASQVHQGISFSHEVGGDWGYGSDSAQRELRKIREIGANSVAIIPFAFTRAPEETSIRFRTDETDARVIRAIEQARLAGLRVMLKPHVWGRGFTGDIEFGSDEAFDLWWESYRSWVLHFARMAELYDVDLLALGNELGGLTSRERAWRDLIRDVRRIYGGAVTYAAHWDGEFERVAFWDQLDLIGVNAYFPLAGRGETPSSESARVAEIRARLAAVAERFGKRVLFTEVGYSSMEGGAEEPWAERSAALDLAIQEQCYEVIFESFAAEPWFAGTYWWKWPSHGRGGPYDLSHRPNGKPAMEVLRRWFQSKNTTSRAQSRGR